MSIARAATHPTTSADHNRDLSGVRCQCTGNRRVPFADLHRTLWQQRRVPATALPRQPFAQRQDYDRCHSSAPVMPRQLGCQLDGLRRFCDIQMHCRLSQTFPIEARLLRSYRRQPLQQILHDALSRSSLYPVIGNGFAPMVACLAATAIVAGIGALALQRGFRPPEPQRHRRDAAGGEADELELAVPDHGAGADFDQRPFRMACG